jgi:radical SAM protein with 4Fe4S-binding SPASM domain
MEGLRNAAEAGLLTTSNAQVNRLNYRRLRDTADMLREAGVAVWRTQLTAPMGNAADRPDWILQPYMMLEVLDTLAELQQEAFAAARQRGLPPDQAFRITLGNNMGYYGPHEQLLRGRPGDHGYWQGCQAGQYVMGLESDGTIKACPSLPTAPYDGGNVRELSLEEIWKRSDVIGFTRESRQDELWGYCADCYYAEVCQAGCSFTAHSTLGRRGNMPFCYHRAHELKKQGQREVLVHATRAPGDPYDFGAFELKVEPWSDADPPVAKRLPVVGS